MTYPNGRVIDYNYGSSGSLNDAISRVDSIGDENNAPTADTLEQYTYLGADTEVGRNRPEDATDMLLYNPSASSGDGLTGLDRYGRIATLNWANASTSGSTDQFSYTYELDDNRLTRTNGLNSAYDEQYTYDNLNRLTDMKRGSSFASPSYQQTWTLDALGNATNLDTTVSGTTTSTAHAFNSQNQISDTGTDYDSNGNQQTLSDTQTGTYDAWNRLVGVDIANDDAESSHGMTYIYDALGRRIGKASYGVSSGTGAADSATTRYFYDNRWHVVEEEGRTSIHGSGHSVGVGHKIATYVWSPGYVDELVERDVATPSTDPIDTTPDDPKDPIDEGLAGSFDAQNIAGAPDGRVYAQQDANYNVTALVGDTDPATSGTQWGVVERYAYSAYGDPTFIDASLSPSTNSDGGTTSGYDFNVLNQGNMYDPNADLYHVRHRVAKFGRWIQEDCVCGYSDGGDLYLERTENPDNYLDPDGCSTLESLAPSYVHPSSTANATLSAQLGPEYGPLTGDDQPQGLEGVLPNGIRWKPPAAAGRRPRWVPDVPPGQKYPGAGGSRPDASWDPSTANGGKPHWDVNDGKGSPVKHITPSGIEIPPEDAHPQTGQPVSTDPSPSAPPGGVAGIGGAVKYPSGVTIYPDGTIGYPNGTTRDPHGVTRFPDGSTIGKGGTLVPKPWAPPSWWPSSAAPTTPPIYAPGFNPIFEPASPVGEPFPVGIPVLAG